MENLNERMLKAELGILESISVLGDMIDLDEEIAENIIAVMDDVNRRLKCAVSQASGGVK